MVTMDVKGITWVGHVYEKFEEMCLDMEEIMYKDTVKYVENQVETVGATIKRFYSDVMRDLLPPPASEDSVKETRYKLYSWQSNDSITCNDSNPLAEKNTGNMTFPSKISDAINPVEENSIKVVSSCEVINENHEAIRDQTTILSSPPNISGSDFIDRMSDKVENANECMPDITFNGDLSVESNDMRGNNGSSSLIVSTNTGAQSNEFSDKEVSVPEPGRQGQCDTYAIENNSLDHGLETIEQTSKICLEKSCVVVSGDELHFVPPIEGKRRPYKKKIRDAFSSRIRSAREQEYKQLAVWYGNDARSCQQSSNCVVDTESQPKHDICESEWEVL